MVDETTNELGSPSDTPPEIIGELQKEEVSKAESSVNKIMTVGGDEPRPGHNMTISTVTMISPATGGQHQQSNRVRVQIKYPQGWKKDKHFKDGDVRDVAKETADQFIQMGFATLVKDDKS